MTIHRKLRTLLVISFLTCLLVQGAIAASVPAENPVDKEIQMGKEAIKDVEKDCKLITDEAILKRVQSIGGKLAAIARSTEVPASYGNSAVAPFEYSFKVIEDKSVNAFSLPGGFIYVHSGLLDFVESDDELAAVLAHEVAHASHHHAKSLLLAQSKLQSRLALILLAGLVGNIPQTDLSHLMLGTQFYKIARVNGYGQEAERDADSTAFAYLIKTSYNPVGMLTFLERLNRRPDIYNLGIFQTHPDLDDRIDQVLNELKDSKIDIHRRSVTRAAKVEVRQATASGICELYLDNKQVIRISGDRSRAESLAADLNATLDGKFSLKDIRIHDSSLAVGSHVIFSATTEDAAVNGMTPDETAKQVSDSLKCVLWQEMVYLIR